MCGITGIFDFQGDRTIDQNTLIRMRDSMFHRGPDEEGIFTRPGVGLGHRRLAIIDITSGQQPFTSIDQNATIVFNGEIFNFQEIRKELEAKGHRFKTHSDTEVILNSWLEWGAGCVDRLRGMFTFAIWDAREKSLFCARDRLGVKPLYYSITADGYFIFGSELKALQQFPGIATDINNHSIESYFALGYIPDPESIYQNIHKLPAGSYIEASRGKVTEPRQYWDLPFSPVELDPENAGEELISRLSEAIDIRLISEVPLGAFLSGGVDSSSVVALMAKLQQTPVKTCSIGFNHPDFDESDYATEVARRYKTDHHTEVVDNDDFSLIDKLIDIYDEPFADSSAIPTYQVCKLAREQVTVALSGDGADELMSGYRHHKMHLREESLRSVLPYPLRRSLFKPLSAIYPKADWAPRWLRAKSTLRALGQNTVTAYFNTVSQNSNDVRNNLFSQDFKQALDGFTAESVFHDVAKHAPSEDPQALIQYLDAKTYLVGDILTKVDRASMANSLEVRTPFLDHKWVEWITGIDNRYKFDGREGKSLLKKSMEPYLPRDLLYRNKMGFSVPLADWFRGPLQERVRELTHGGHLEDSGMFDVSFLKRIETEHRKKLKDHSTLLWSLLTFERFLEKSKNRVAS
jgi:asparagine synthase (glutamine-hydrolysing)